MEIEGDIVYINDSASTHIDNISDISISSQIFFDEFMFNGNKINAKTECSDIHFYNATYQRYIYSGDVFYSEIVYNFIRKELDCRLVFNVEFNLKNKQTYEDKITKKIKISNPFNCYKELEVKEKKIILQDLSNKIFNRTKKYM